MPNINDRLELVFNAEYVRRLLNRYFMEDKKITDADATISPVELVDLLKKVPQLYGKVEISPDAEEIDPQTGFARLNWNLFVLGNNRMFIGQTDHSNIHDVARLIRNGASPGDITSEGQDNYTSRRESTPRRIVNFVVDIISSNMNGLIRDADNITIMPNGATAGLGSSSMFERPKPIRGEGGAR